MGLPVPPNWIIESNLTTGDFRFIDGIVGNVIPRASGMEVYNAIIRYLLKNPKGNTNEQHRQSDQTPRNLAIAQHPAGNSGGAAPSFGPAAPSPRPLTAAEYTALARANPGSIMALSPGVTMSDLIKEMTHQRALLQQTLYVGNPSFVPLPYKDPVAAHKPLPRTAPTVGELIGHRAWKVEGGNLLRSYSAGSAWFPGQPMQDKIGKGLEIDDHNTAGIWAFKDPYELAHEFYGEIQGSGVFGTVWLWGTVIEHERGYRAQYATIRSLDRAGKGVDLEVLRAAYLPSKPAEVEK
jgi:hypothetical protein